MDNKRTLDDTRTNSNRDGICTVYLSLLTGLQLQVLIQLFRTKRRIAEKAPGKSSSVAQRNES